jgi:HTH-type transcriptional regulator/antitoxin HigA
MDSRRRYLAMEISDAKPIASAEEYALASQALDALLDRQPQRDTADGDRLEWLSAAIEAYEAKHYPDEMFATSPQDVVDFILEQRGMQRGDLGEIMGGKSRVSEFFAGKRELSRTQIRALRDLLGIPADLLL